VSGMSAPERSREPLRRDSGEGSGRGTDAAGLSGSGPGGDAPTSPGRGGRGLEQASKASFIRANRDQGKQSRETTIYFPDAGGQDPNTPPLRSPRAPDETPGRAADPHTTPGAMPPARNPAPGALPLPGPPEVSSP